VASTEASTPSPIATTARSISLAPTLTSASSSDASSWAARSSRSAISSTRERTLSTPTTR